MAFTKNEILEEFNEVAVGVYVNSESTFYDIVQQHVRYLRARWYGNYQRMHAKLEWRKARALKAKNRRAHQRAECGAVREGGAYWSCLGTLPYDTYWQYWRGRALNAEKALDQERGEYVKRSGLLKEAIAEIERLKT